MKHPMKSALFLILSLMPTFSSASHSTELKKSLLGIEESKRTTAQKLVFETMTKFNSALTDLGCEPNLATAEPGLATTRVDAVLGMLPPWLEHLAQKAFVERVTFDPRTEQLLKGFNFNTDLSIDVKSSGPDGDKIADLIRRQWLEVPPTQDPSSHGPIKATVSDLRALDGHVSFALQVGFSNGQRLNLKFSRVDLGREQVAPRVARLAIAAINHRDGLASEDRVRQEMNAFRYDLGKVLRVTNPEYQGKVEQLRERLVEAQPKTSIWKTFGRNLMGRAKGQDETLGTAFAAYMGVRESIVELSQTARLQRLDDKAPTDEKDQVEIVQRTRPSIAPGKLARTFVAPRAPAVAAARPAPSRSWTRRQDPAPSDTYFFNTYVWITDPSFMMTHPLYWGSHDGSFWSYMMYYDWMTEQQHRREHAFVDQVAPMPQAMNNFDRPVDPLYTNDPTAPYANPWDSSVPAADTITPLVGNDGTVQWSDRSGQPVDMFYMPATQVDQAWNQVTGGDTALSAPERPDTTVNLTPEDNAAWTNGGSGSTPDATPDPKSEATGY